MLVAISKITLGPPRYVSLLRHLAFAAECVRLKSALIDQAAKTAKAEEDLRAARKQIAELTRALHRANSRD